MRVLVTGTSGFIGQHLATALSEHGHEVIGLDRRQPRLPVNYVFHECDILDTAKLTQVVSATAPHAIVHLAARTDLGETHDLGGYAANIEGVANLIAAIRATP